MGSQPAPPPTQVAVRSSVRAAETGASGDGGGASVGLSAEDPGLNPGATSSLCETLGPP